MRTCLTLAAICLAQGIHAEPLTFDYSRGRTVTFPAGAISFADEVVSYRMGSEVGKPQGRNPASGLGVPDYDGDANYITLGCRGELVLKFTDNALVDGPGEDLFIFEIGPDVEGTEIEISTDGVTWLPLGTVEGATSALDLSAAGIPGGFYHYVKLIDDGVQCSGNTPGADIDAVGAIGTIARPAPAPAPVPLPDPEPSPAAPAQSAYDDGRGGNVLFQGGDASFADRVVSYAPGTVPNGNAVDPAKALQAPDYGGDDGYVTLGCNGEIVLEFTDNVLIDVPGDDLFIFEIGPDVEGTRVDISADGREWWTVGVVEGATSALDISQMPKQPYSFVRLIDDGVQCSGRTPGADIDAVGAIGSGARVVLDSSVLFDFDSDALKPEALGQLFRIAATVQAQPGMTVRVFGHTDAKGSDAYNMTLSQKRALAVRAVLEGAGVPANRIRARGYGEERPIAPNDSEAGRAQNRRVELLLLPG